MIITSEELHNILDYNPEDGEFRRRIKKGMASLNGFAGTRRKDGYKQICINGKLYLAHRLAWLYVYGTWPNKHIDHIDNNPSNNRIDNLRLANYSQNSANSSSRRKLDKGIRYYLGGRSFYVRIKVNDKELHLGSFKNIEDARMAYKAAAVQYFGEYARV